MFQRDFSLGSLKLDVVDEQQRNAVDCKVRRARKKDEADRVRCAKVLRRPGIFLFLGLAGRFLCLLALALALAWQWRG